jgi:hypothetical protein
MCTPCAGKWSTVRLPSDGQGCTLRKMPRLLSFALLLAACSGTPKGVAQVVITPPPAPETRATLAGPLCADGKCACRDPRAAADGGAGLPEGEAKRFEIKIGPSEHELWVTLDDMVLYKGTARAEECFYVDLGQGDHQMGLRASHEGGISARVVIHELGTTTKSWYDTFSFMCGAPGVCAHQELDEQKAEYARYKRGIHDPCGSVKVKQIGWDTGVAPDQLHPDDLQAAWILQIYEFAPKKPHGDASCADKLE